jgi:hypothetical protein
MLHESLSPRLPPSPILPYCNCENGGASRSSSQGASQESPMKFAVVSSRLCLCRRASALETEELATFGGRPLTNWNDPPALVHDKLYGEKTDLEEGVNVIQNFLDPQELAYFNALAEAATREKAPGSFIYSAHLSAKLVQRFNAVWRDGEFCTEDAEAPVMVEMSKLFSDIDHHADHLPNDLLISGYTALVALTDSHNALVWGKSTRVPLVANSVTHSVSRKHHARNLHGVSR